MNFQIRALPAPEFASLFELPDDELAARHAKRVQVTENPGTPCRVSMQDAEVGETVILLNYTHLPAHSPFAAKHAIFVRKNVKEARLEINEVPKVLTSRTISMRFFDMGDMMIDADLAEGAEIAAVLSKSFDNPDVAYAHLHYAKPGCFAASAHRA